MGVMRNGDAARVAAEPVDFDEFVVVELFRRLWHAWVRDGRDSGGATTRRRTPGPCWSGSTSTGSAVWTGEQVIIWGDPDRGFKANTADGLTWTPPPAGS